MFAIGVYSIIIGYSEVEFWKFANTNFVKNITIMHEMIGFVMSLLLVFRTNIAYDHWWKGCKMWAAPVNNSRHFDL